jgi:hypothetical protein
VSDLTFAQASRRNFTLPIVIAVVVLGVAGGLIYYWLPKTDADARITGVVVHPIKTVYKAPDDMRAGAHHKVQDVNEADLYVIPMVRIENHLGVPIDLKDFTVSLVTAQGGLSTSAVEKGDLSTVFQAYPEIKPLMGTPLLRETSVPAKQGVQGTLLLQFPVQATVWEQRQSATLTIDFYRQTSITIPFPKP